MNQTVSVVGGGGRRQRVNIKKLTEFRKCCKANCQFHFENGLTSAERQADMVFCLGVSGETIMGNKAVDCLK